MTSSRWIVRGDLGNSVHSLNNETTLDHYKNPQTKFKAVKVQNDGGMALLQCVEAPRSEGRKLAIIIGILQVYLNANSNNFPKTL